MFDRLAKVGTKRFSPRLKWIFSVYVCTYTVYKCNLVTMQFSFLWQTVQFMQLHCTPLQISFFLYSIPHMFGDGIAFYRHIHSQCDTYLNWYLLISCLVLMECNHFDDVFKTRRKKMCVVYRFTHQILLTVKDEGEKKICAYTYLTTLVWLSNLRFHFKHRIRDD